jgi:hypothetical protein
MTNLVVLRIRILSSEVRTDKRKFGEGSASVPTRCLIVTTENAVFFLYPKMHDDKEIGILGLSLLVNGIFVAHG